VPVSKTSNFNADLHLTKTLRSGGNFGIDFTNNRFVSNATFQGLVPQYRPELVFSLNQPLLRNFGSNFAYLLINLSTITSEAGQFTYRAQLADFVKQVVDAYWAVVFARENVKVQQEALDLARRTVHENDERVRVGLLAPVSVKEAQSQAASIEAQLIVAQNNLDNTRRTLRHLVYLQTGDTIVPRQIEPVEEPRIAPVTVNAEAALDTALEQRPEILAANLDLRGRNLTARIRENQLLPKLDLVGNFGLNGLSGKPVPTTDFNGNVIVSPFSGSYGKALDRLTSRDFYSYTAGVEVEIPLGNAAAKAAYSQARIDVSQGTLNRKQLLSDITLEVGNAVNNVNANIQRIRATRVARELAEENLRNQEKRLEVGLTTTKDVLDFQNDLTQARATEVQAATDYNISLDELARAEGTLLDKYSVVVEIPGTRFVPWWARF
jgi:outer membrane protein